jgi:hypothetical protein
MKEILGLQRGPDHEPTVHNAPNMVGVEKVVANSDIYDQRSPHNTYRILDFQGKPAVDVWAISEENGP